MYDLSSNIDHNLSTKKELDKKRLKLNLIKESIFEKTVLFFSLISLICIIIITVFIFAKGVPSMLEIGIKEFLLGTKWNPDKEIFGILPMIIGTFSVTFIALLLGIPVGMFTGIYITFYSKGKLKNIIISSVELLGSIPSTIYGFFGLIVIVPIINKMFAGLGAGNSMLSASLILSIMILPTIIITTKSALDTIPKQYIEGAIALGSSKEQTIFKVGIPSVKSSILSGVLLGTGRAVGETMAILLVSGNTVLMPDSNILTTLTNPIRTLTANIALEMGYSTGLHQGALFATGVVLFALIMLINLLGHFANSKTK